MSAQLALPLDDDPSRSSLGSSTGSANPEQQPPVDRTSDAARSRRGRPGSPDKAVGCVTCLGCLSWPTITKWRKHWDICCDVCSDFERHKFRMVTGATREGAVAEWNRLNARGWDGAEPVVNYETGESKSGAGSPSTEVSGGYRKETNL